MTFLVATVAWVAFGVLVGRWWSLAVPAVSALGFFAGAAAGLWAGGLAWGWPLILAVVLTHSCAATAVGVLARKRAGRLGVPTGWPLSTGRLGAALVAFAAIVVAVGPPAIDALASRPDTDFELEDVKAMRGAPLYYVGDSFEGLPLTAIIGNPSRNLTFIYGDCDIPIGIDPGGCPPPLEVQNEVCPDRTIVVLFPGGSVDTARARAAVRPVNDERAPRPLVVMDANPGCGGG